MCTCAYKAAIVVVLHNVRGYLVIHSLFPSEDEESC